MTDRPLPRERLPVGLEYRAAAPLTQAMGSIAGARAAWALAHGLVMLEINGRFPADADIDAAWEAGITPATGTPPADLISYTAAMFETLIREWDGEFVATRFDDAVRTWMFMACTPPRSGRASAAPG